MHNVRCFIQLLMSDMVSLVSFDIGQTADQCLILSLTYIFAIEGQVRWRLALQLQGSQHERNASHSLELVTSRPDLSFRDVGRQLKYCCISQWGQQYGWKESWVRGWEEESSVVPNQRWGLGPSSYIY